MNLRGKLYFFSFTQYYQVLRSSKVSCAQWGQVTFEFHELISKFSHNCRFIVCKITHEINTYSKPQPKITIASKPGSNSSKCLLYIFVVFVNSCLSFEFLSESYDRMYFEVYGNFKVQLISKCLFGVFNSPKKRMKTIRLEVPQQ